MSSEFIDESGKTTCVVCRKKKSVGEVNLCMGCEKFACASGCGSFSHKHMAWLCKKCQAKSK